MDEQPADEELVAAFRTTGEIRALNGLAERHIPRVRALLHQMVLNEADADDLTQEVFLRAFHGLEGFEGRSRFSTWLYRIAMNTARTFLRSRTRTPACRGEELAEEPDRGGGGPDQAAMARELDADIEAALGSLSPTLRAAIVLTAIHGLNGREAARIEGCATATMYWRVHKARKILKRQLGHYLA